MSDTVDILTLAKQVEELQKHIILLQGAVDNIKYIQMAQAEYINHIQVHKPSQDMDMISEDNNVKLEPHFDNYIARFVANIHLR